MKSWHAGIQVVDPRQEINHRVPRVNLWDRLLAAMAMWLDDDIPVAYMGS
jgi:hypothetical protein